MSSQNLISPCASVRPTTAVAKSQRPIRVGYVIYKLQMGGLERCVCRLVNSLPRELFQPVIICLDRTGTAREWITADDVEVIEMHKRPCNDVRVIGRLAKVFREQKLDVVHSHNWGTLVETSLAKRWSGVARHVHAERGMELEDLHAPAWKRRLRNAAARWAINQADSLVTNAESIHSGMAARFGRIRTPVTIIPNGVDRPDISGRSIAAQKCRAAVGIPRDAFVVTSVGRLVTVKDFPLAIDAVARLVHNNCPVHLLLVGDGPERARLESLCREKNVVNHVHFAGATNEVSRWLMASDVYLNCSLSEGMSQSIVEAMSHGLPLVVTDVGDNAKMANAPYPSGYVVRPGDSKQLADAIRAMYSQPERLQAFAHNSLQKYGASYTLESMCERYEELYLNLVLGSAKS